jgi:carbon monoxide dehydrogenase subunit G
MQLEHQFTVPAPVDVVWKALLDPELVAPCMPGASLSKVEGDEFAGSVKVKLGPVNLTYKGTGQFVEKDEQARRAVMKASGKDVRGNSTASATITLELRPDGTGTTATVTSDLSITGRPAQMGRGMITEVGGKILNSFATNLAARLAPEPVAAETAAGQASAEPTGEQGETETTRTGTEAGTPGSTEGAQGATGGGARAEQRQAAEPESLNLLSAAAGPVLKRVLPVLAVIVLAVVIYLILRHR